MRILVTGFDPFGGEKVNPAWEAVKNLPDSINGIEIKKVEIPTVFGKAEEVTKKIIKECNPDYVLNVGQAGGRFSLSPERVAINIDDARIPDNEGNQPIDTVIQENGEAAYFTQLPIKAMVDSIKKSKISAAVSNSAGTFVCNHIMYQVQYMIHKEYPSIKGGFIHVPYIPEQTKDKPNMPSMRLSDITKGLFKAIETIIAFDGKEDIKEVGGALH